MAVLTYEAISKSQVESAMYALGLDPEQVAELSITYGYVAVTYIPTVPSGAHTIAPTPSKNDRTILYPICAYDEH